MTKLLLVFLCTSLEPRRDGVGDYTRRLAGTLAKQGHRISIIGVNDKFLESEWIGIQYEDDEKILVLRLPSIWPEKQRFLRAKQWIDKLNPHWLSLQYVPFGFHQKGLSFSLNRRLFELGKGRNWHIMFHELWVGMDAKVLNKLYWWGKVQRYVVKDLVDNLKPKVIHTQSIVYQNQLSTLSISAYHLPLFPNIPVYSLPFTETTIDCKSKASEINMVIFGGIHPNAPIDAFTDELVKYIQLHKRTVVLNLIGRSGPEQLRWARIWQSKGLLINILGEKSSEDISAVLQKASFGISTTPIQLAEKSSSVASMAAHGLAVLFITRPWQARNSKSIPLPFGFTAYIPGNLAACIEFCQNNKPVTYSVSVTAKQFSSFLLNS